MKTPAHYADAFQMHRAALQDLYGMLPDEQGTFAPWEGGMSFIGLADHLAASSQRMLGRLGEEEAPPPILDTSGSADLPSARSRLQESTENALLTIRALSEEDLSRRVTAFGREMPVAALLDFLIQHEAHHKGQVWMMARMVGVKPPMFVKLG